MKAVCVRTDSKMGKGRRKELGQLTACVPAKYIDA